LLNKAKFSPKAGERSVASVSNKLQSSMLSYLQLMISSHYGKKRICITLKWFQRPEPEVIHAKRRLQARNIGVEKFQAQTLRFYCC